MLVKLKERQAVRISFPHFAIVLPARSVEQRRRFLLNSGGRHGERGARAYNGGLGAEPPAGSKGRAPGQGVRGEAPEAERKLNFDNTITPLILHLNKHSRMSQKSV